MIGRYEDTLKTLLTDPDEAAAYLNAALDDGDQEVFLLALRDVADARGMTRTARGAHLNRESLYRMLSSGGNPQLASLSALLNSFGLRLAIEVEQTIREAEIGAAPAVAEGAPQYDETDSED
jgi:probable addiction module antidote protein